MKGFKTDLNNVPSLVYYQSKGGDTFEAEQSIVVEFFRGTVSLIQGNNIILIDDDYLKDLCKTIINSREKANKFLNDRV